MEDLKLKKNTQNYFFYIMNLKKALDHTKRFSEHKLCIYVNNEYRYDEDAIDLYEQLIKI